MIALTSSEDVPSVRRELSSSRRASCVLSVASRGAARAEAPAEHLGRGREEMAKISAWTEQDVLGFLEDLLEDQIAADNSPDAAGTPQLRGAEILPGETPNSFVLSTPPRGRRFEILVRPVR